MVAKIAFRGYAACLVALAVLLIVPLSAYSQVTLTGAVQFSTNSLGTAAPINVAQVWNTLGGDSFFDLWLAKNADASSPINGPSDAQAGFSFPLEIGGTYTFYMFGAPGCCSEPFNGLNLFFDGNNSTPGISVFGPINGIGFAPNASSTFSLGGTFVSGASSAAYSAAGAVVALTEYNWNAPATLPGDVCQSHGFTPGTQACYFGSFSLRVFPAAALGLSQTSDSPFTKNTVTGSGFAPNELVYIFGGHIGLRPVIAAATANASGSFSVAGLDPQNPVGPMNVYAYGLTSGKLGAVTLFVASALATYPETAAPGSVIVAYPIGFGASETVGIYWNQPRQLLGTATTNSLGSGALAITLPSNATPGLNGVFGVGATTGSLGLGAVLVK